ncbi:type II secretion system major pseudopilin GspG [Paraferrimonas sp. SM1919]|uniref:type II secretion system major pseudopilin GspG n=1 Tax=Paraferrimonas sp. SM1919 TaxID=2662263 RepID=UPI0013D7A10E|nr:type II secretion system major pseudopilin GspG [Paraferrimonas sp. SM1919]
MKSRKKANKQQGFTLLEVMVVLVIIGLLGAIVAPNVLGNKEKADRQKTVTDITTLESALNMYKLDNSRYPTTEQGLEALIEKPSISPEPRNYTEGGYIMRLPQDPWGGDYYLVSPGENGVIDIFSAGPDMEVGTEDDIGNWNLQDN